MGEFPEKIKELIEIGEPLSRKQLRLLIEIEAEYINLTFDEAVEKANNRELPHTAIGADLSMLIEMYELGEN